MNILDLTQFSSYIKDAIWNYWVVYLLLILGVFFSFKLRFVQVRNLGNSIKLCLENPGKKAVSAFAALSVTSAARIGAGNLAGVAVAISQGGAGSIFWMWVFAILGASGSFIENTLAQIYKKKTSNPDIFTGGPAYYMKDGMGKRWMGILFCIFIIIGYGIFLNSFQANTISYAFNYFLGIPRYIVGIASVILVGVCIFGGLKRISRVTEVLFPSMTTLYVILVAIVIIINIDRVPIVFTEIFAGAFGFKAAAWGGIGAILKFAIQGAEVGLFANEAGLGTAPIAAAGAKVSHPAKQGLVQVVGVLIDTFIVCTATAFLILFSGVIKPGITQSGIEITQLAMSSVYGKLGTGFVALLVLLFSFTTIIANYYYAEVSVGYFTKRRVYIFLTRLIVLGIVMIGSLATLEIVWNFTNFFLGIMVTINLIALACLYKYAVAAKKDYYAQLGVGKNPVFKKESVKGLENVECW